MVSRLEVNNWCSACLVYDPWPLGFFQLPGMVVSRRTVPCGMLLARKSFFLIGDDKISPREQLHQDVVKHRCALGACQGHEEIYVKRYHLKTILFRSLLLNFLSYWWVPAWLKFYRLCLCAWSHTYINLDRLTRTSENWHIFLEPRVIFLICGRFISQ